MTWRVREIKPWFIPLDGIPRQFFSASVNEGEPTKLLAKAGTLFCLEHFMDADCLCRQAVRDSQLLNEASHANV